MLNFQNKSSLIFILFVPLAFSCSANDLSPARSCVENVSGFKIVRADDENHRYFVTQENISTLSDKELLTKLSKCFVKTDWIKDWSISLFSEKRFAGYVDEPTIIPLHKGNQWAEAYLAEYNGAKNSVTKYPAQAKSYY